MPITGITKPDVTPASTAPQDQFIPSIEGMRALAVLAVLLFHLGLPGVTGGFLGVDLFFVISGFIITRNILSDVAKDRFSLGDFYVRRLRRLLPALLFTVLITLVVALALLPPLQLAQTARSAFYAIFSLANINFWLEAGYFDANSHAKPLLHTWSLSVEEQFYLFWPALLLVLKDFRQRYVVVALLLTASLAATIFYRHDLADAVFYLLPFRVHQLMTGALIAILALRMTGAMANVFALLATGGFIVAVMEFGDRYPPAIGAVAISFLGFFLLLSREAAVAKLVLGSSPMQWIGRRSYALYLVHWPIIVLFMYATEFELSHWDRLLLFVASVAAAVLLHSLVEQPFRKRGVDTTVAQRMAIPVTLSVLLFNVLMSVSLWLWDGLPGRSNMSLQPIVDSVNAEKEQREKAIRYGQCNLHRRHTMEHYDVAHCATTVPGRTNVAIIGDSLAADTYMLLASAYPDIHFLQATAGACTAITKIDNPRQNYPACRDLNAYRFGPLLEQELDLVVLASNWTTERIDPLKATVEHLRSMDKRILIIGPRVVFRGSVPLLISQGGSLDEVKERITQRVKHKDALLMQMRTELPEQTIVDIESIQCTPHCDALLDNRLMYFDGMHLTVWGADIIGQRFRQMFDLPAFIGASAMATSVPSSLPHD